MGLAALKISVQQVTKGKALALFSVTLLSAALFRTPFAQAATFTSQSSLGSQVYANEGAPTARAELNLSLESESRLYVNRPLPEGKPAREAHLYSFFESGSAGDSSFDIDQTAVRVGAELKEFAGHFWVGRVHPAREGKSPENAEILATSALGASWAQNQSNPLSPRVAGWIGGGLHIRNETTGVYITAAGSPFFLPSFGPRVDYSETVATTGSRFAHLPPQTVNLNGTEFPLRYRIDTGNLKNIVLQRQLFVAFGHSDQDTDFQVMSWSAPSPSPATDTEALLRIHSERDLNVLILARPRFEREVFIGAQWSLRSTSPFPTLQAIYERNSRRLALSAGFRLGDFFRGGMLHTLDTGREAAPEGPLFSPTYAKALTWAEIGTGTLLGAVRPQLRIERHLGDSSGGQWLKPSLSYQSGSNFALFASADILTGADRSYFGAWRDLDSVSMGVRYLW